jgi:hypothetical protein
MSPRRRGAQRAALAVLAGVVTLAHLGLGQRLAALHPGGAADRLPPRIDVAFVRELAPTAPPAPPARSRPAPAAAPAAERAVPAPDAAPPPEPAASAPQPVVPPPVEPSAPSAPPAEASTVAATEPAGATAAPSPLSADTPATAEGPAGAAADAHLDPWPLSTRISYRLEGHFRGPVQGQARVDWLREGRQYQVHLELQVGPFFAPLASRRLVSVGDITPTGLQPRLYQEETRVALREPRRMVVALEPDTVRLAGGAVLPRPAGVQDSASQFVHMTWLFATQPQRLQAGQLIELPVALPRSLEPWTYEVLGTERLATPVGELEAVHVRPRREPRPGLDLTAEFWVAPTLQYLPVRIFIRQSADTWIDLQIDRLPQQAAAPSTAPPAPPANAAPAAPRPAAEAVR